MPHAMHWAQGPATLGHPALVLSSPLLLGKQKGLEAGETCSSPPPPVFPRTAGEEAGPPGGMEVR